MLIDTEHALAHNKVILIDGDTVITGSFNFSRAAEERNAENLLVIRDQELAEKYSRFSLPVGCQPGPRAVPSPV